MCRANDKESTYFGESDEAIDSDIWLGEVNRGKPAPLRKSALRCLTHDHAVRQPVQPSISQAL